MVVVSDIGGGEPVLPRQLEILRRAIKKNWDVLEKGGRIRFPRKRVRDAFDCGQYVSDSQIIGILSDKLNTLERENIFNGKKFDSGFERDLQTDEEDRIVYVQFHKGMKEALDLDDTIDPSRIIPMNDREKDEATEVPEVKVAGTSIKNEKFNLSVKEQQKRKEQSERDRQKAKDAENKEQSEEQKETDTTGEQYQ
jgi:hypothetical protein